MTWKNLIVCHFRNELKEIFNKCLVFFYIQHVYLESEISDVYATILQRITKDYFGILYTVWLVESF